ncbi:MAG TPA: hypothetical protein VLX28_10500, partial [Thermoanaerobaculia bacterium]|nr:hypothetical protein [Thermoanaerobaculia bacterium]
KTDLKSYNAKLNAQIATNNSATAFYLDSDKIKIGRNAGPTRPQETTFDQGRFGDKPTAYKFEDTHIFSSSFYLTGLYSHVNGGFQLAPEGGLSRTPFLDNGGVWHNSFELFNTIRPQKQYKADASNFFNTGNLSHELKFGGGYRQADVTSLTTWPNGTIVLDAAAAGTSLNLLEVVRNGGAAIKQTYKDAYAQDTLTSGNLTVNIGVRYDVQGGENQARSQPANPFLPNVLPTVSTQSHDIGFEWKSFTPRLGLTYALGAERKTLLRASYSRFADQLGTATGSWLNTLNLPGYAYFYTTNTGQPIVTQGQLIDIGEPTITTPFAYSANVNPNTGGLLQSNALASGLTAPKTDELLLGVEHALLPEFVVGLNLTYRKTTDLLQSDLLVFDSTDPFSATNLNSTGRRATRADYTPVQLTGVLPNGQSYNITRYILNSNLSTRGGGFLYNGNDETTYKGASVTFNKRLANRWMLRGNVSYSDWYYSTVEKPDPTPLLGGPNNEGDAVIQGSGTGSGSKGGVYINSKWSYSLNGLYQIAPDRPWGFNAALNLTGRQAYPVPYFRRVQLPGNEQFVTENVAVTSRPDSFRLDDIHIIDARIEKEFSFSDFGLTLGVDCFNLFNQSYVLQRNNRLAQSSSDNVREIVSPRVLRLGARLSFR